MGSRYHPDKNKSQIVFDITGGEKQLQTMNLSTIPNRPPLIKSEKESFILRNDDIDGARYVAPKVNPRNTNLDTTDIPGTRSRPMVNHQKPAVDIMRLDDIEGSKPRIIRQLPHSKRMVNPVDPKYDIPPFVCPIEDTTRFLRDTMKNDDVEGAQPMSYKTDKPPRDIMKVDDIAGTRPSQKIRQLRKGNDQMDVRDINNDRVFKSKRVTDPLNPVYIYDGEVKGEGVGTLKAPMRPHPGFDLTTSDIPGAQADTMTAKYRTFRQPKPEADDDTKPAEILMVPSMEKQTKELEAQNIARMQRSEKLRFYENRNLHAEYGTGDPVQAMLRRQRESKVNVKPHNTF